jgi:hypothetical protein
MSATLISSVRTTALSRKKSAPIPENPDRWTCSACWADLDFDNVLPIVIRSHQLLPGVGGIYPADLMSAWISS